MNTIKKFGSKQVSIVQIENKYYIKSYETLVSEINYENHTITLIDWNAKCKSNGFNNKAGQTITHSATTTRQINFVARQLNFNIIK
jgi:Zn/Cd-binding protein ZinT